MNFNSLYRAAMQKRAAAVLTPEAEQAAMQGMADPSMAGGMPPQDPAAMGGAPMPPEGGAPMPPQGGMPGTPQGSGGGQLPPEIMQDQQFLQWLAQQGVQMDPASGMFIGPDGQPLPAEAIMQAYQAYQQEMVAAQGGGAMPPEAGGMPPQDPAAMGGAPMPPEGGAPMPPGGAPAQGQLPPEILQDQVFIQFLQEVAGAQLDPNSGMFIDMQSGQPIPPEGVMQAYQMFQQQMAAQGGGAPQDMGGDPAAMGGAPEQPPMEGGAQPGMPPEIMEQFQSAIDSSIENFTTQLDKKIEALMDKLETVKMAIESMRDTDDQRSKQDKDALKQMQDDLAAELNPTTKTASEKKRPQAGKTSRPVNVFDFLATKK